MSHFVVAVILPERTSAYTSGSVKRKVTELMEPYNEDGEWFRDGSRWDWWVIGGRWDGSLRGLSWDPKLKVCDLCHGSGVRPDGVERFGMEWVVRVGCNGCSGSGKQEAWPTDDHYQSLERNMCPMTEVSAEFEPTAFIRPTGEWVESERIGFWGMGIPDEEGRTKDEKVSQWDQDWADARRRYRRHLVVSVDAHV